MKFSLKYLLQFIEYLSSCNPDKISKQLTNLGIEVESCVEEEKDYIFEVAVAPNRADLLSLVGIARELAALNNTKLKMPELKDDINDILLNSYDNNSKKLIEVKVLDQHACPKYLSRVIRNIKLDAITPEWMQKELQHAGINLISPVVDITNYVMLELGQPLHAFDLAKITGNKIIIRRAKPQEELMLLDGNKIILDQQDLIIADPDKPLAIAGIIGGIDSAIAEHSKDIVLECAYFEPIIIRMTSRRHNLITDASHRFTRNIDPTLQHVAMLRVSELLKEIVGGEFGPVMMVVNESLLPAETVISLNRLKITEVIGNCFSDRKIISTLEKLNMQLTPRDNVGWDIKVPFWRQDLKIPEDLIEEIARFLGYNNIIKQQISLPVSFKFPETRLSFFKELQYKKCLVNRGYYEVINYSFIDPEFAKLFYPHKEFYQLKNPMSQNMSVMRTGLWPGLVNSLLHNQHRQNNRIRLFELGTVFLFNAKTQRTEQKKKLAGIVSGTLFEENWNSKMKQEVDFFAVKSDIEALISWNNNVNVIFKPTKKIAALHNSQAAEIYINNAIIGMVGMIHPSLIKKLSLTAPILLFELDLESIANNLAVPRFVNFSKFPAVRRDFSVMINDSVTCSQIQQVIQDSCGALLRKIIFFDVYKNSIAFGVILQNLHCTLENQEIIKIETNIIENLNKIGVMLKIQS